MQPVEGPGPGASLPQPVQDLDNPDKNDQPTVKPAENEPKYRTEFHRIYAEKGGIFDPITEKYPLFVVVSIVVLGMLGVFNVFSFSITSILSGVIFLGLSVSLGQSVRNAYSKQDSNFWRQCLNSVWQILETVFHRSEDKKPPAETQAQKAQEEAKPEPVEEAEPQKNVDTGSTSTDKEKAALLWRVFSFVWANEKLKTD